LNEDRNPNTNGARLILASTSEPGANLMAIANAVKDGQIRALAVLGENPMHLGISVEALAQIPALIAMDILGSEGTEKASVVLPACGFAEKRGSVINGKGRLQRLNRAIRPPGNARDDWEILRDLVQAIGGGDSLHSIEDVFRRISETVSQFAGLSLSKIGDLGVHILQMEELPAIEPGDCKLIEQAIAIQAARRAVRQRLHQARSDIGVSRIEPNTAPRL
jgi:NADH-quinone oxidoreductase subunit G